MNTAALYKDLLQSLEKLDGVASAVDAAGPSTSTVFKTRLQTSINIYWSVSVGLALANLALSMLFFLKVGSVYDMAAGMLFITLSIVLHMGLLMSMTMLKFRISLFGEIPAVDADFPIPSEHSIIVVPTKNTNWSGHLCAIRQCLQLAANMVQIDGTLNRYEVVAATSCDVTAFRDALTRRSPKA